ncbi:alpha/beta hydrolase family protein [Cellulomonas dongxiuzhuiae]|uniref:alpha/beta hydrolase family protein n=1 Tax=Cellulomonas dongxiuzhuiae TaxID=2819979 RepID=UPI001AB000DF|nr:alpha/beta family hydrolase [Cellulomonas dongxiuzhuiae]MBO3088000.1 dienelactone hydrolase [Cellulomonas dongxiuzhuiae]
MADVRVLRAGSGPVDVAGVLLAPGAGATRDNRTLVALDTALTAAGIPVRRIDLPRGAKAAPARVREEADAFAAELGVATERLVVGGRSFGGRMSSMAVADGLAVAGLLLLSYPLHPPGRPEQLRIAHLPRIDVPVLAVSGAADPFGTPDELTAHLAAVTGPVTLVLVAGAHAPTDPPVVAAVRDWLA